MTRLNVDKRERHGAVSGHLPEFIFGGLEPVAFSQLPINCKGLEIGEKDRVWSWLRVPDVMPSGN